MIGRAAVISSGFSRKKVEKNRLRQYYEEVSQHPQKVIKHSKYPIPLWFIGLFCLAVGLVMIWHIAFNIEATLFSDFRKGTWWQYLISIGITVLGVLFILGGKISKLELNRDADLVMIKKTNVICRKQKTTRKLSECINVQIIKKGIITQTTNTSHYKLMLYFLVGAPLCIYESGDELKTKRKFVDVVNYLGIDLDPDNIVIVDHTIKQNSRDQELDRL